MNEIFFFSESPAVNFYVGKIIRIEKEEKEGEGGRKVRGARYIGI